MPNDDGINSYTPPKEEENDDEEERAPRIVYVGG
jgi:hypothetical protein